MSKKSDKPPETIGEYIVLLGFLAVAAWPVTLTLGAAIIFVTAAFIDGIFGTHITKILNNGH